MYQFFIQFPRRLYGARSENRTKILVSKLAAGTALATKFAKHAILFD
jgi:hypothetical protein